MNKLLVVGLSLAAFCVYAETNTPKKVRGPSHTSKGYLRHTGGDLIKPGSMKGSVAIAYEAPCAAIDEVVRGLKEIYHLDAKAVKVDASPDIVSADEALAGLHVNAAVFLIDRLGYPSLLVSPERRWAMVNLKALNVGSPKPDDLKWRVRKELWRAYAYVCGAGTTDTPGCVMNPVFSLEDLDALKTDMISPDPVMSINNCQPKMGIAPFIRTTYKAACIEGWAQPPTNEYQKLVWDKVHSMPTKPMRIVPESKRSTAK